MSNNGTQPNEKETEEVGIDQAVETQTKPEQKKKEKSKLTIALSIIALIIIIIILLLLKQCGGKPAVTPGSSTSQSEIETDSSITDIVKPDKSNIQSQLDQQVEDGMINISMNTQVEFEDGKSEGNVGIVNDPRNKYPQTVEIKLDSTGETIYQSKGIPVGKAIEKAKLTKDLEKGTYECTAYFTAFNDETNKGVGTAGAKIVLTVKN